MVRWLRKLAIWLALILAGLCLAFLMLRSRYREVIRDLAQTQVKNTTSDLTNDAIAKQIAQGIIRYDRIVFFEKDLDGRITALKTNMSEVNRLKTDILNLINDEILALDTSDIGIPLGSIFLPELLSGKGACHPGAHSGHPQFRCGIFQLLFPGGNQPDPSPAEYECQRRCGRAGAGTDQQLYRGQSGGCGRNHYRGQRAQHFFTNRRKL